jgi:phosphatidylserine/phosphatidylglycerophosphate/cardiolipin synthase-like enzyme
VLAVLLCAVFAAFGKDPQNIRFLAQQPWVNARPAALLTQLEGVYNQGEAAPLVPLIRAAKKTIDIEIYEMQDSLVLEALMEAKNKRGVRIRIVKDDSPVGDSCRFFSKRPQKPSCQSQFRLFRELRSSKSGDRFVAFNKDVSCGLIDTVDDNERCFQHGKIMIVDDEIVLLSTGNFNPTSICNKTEKISTCNRDYSVVTRNPSIVGALKDVFASDLEGKRPDIKAILRRHNAESLLTVSPFSYEPIAAFIRSATKSIQLQNQYLYANSELVEVLAERARAGVRVEIQLADVCHFGSVSERRAYENDLTFRFLEDAGVLIRMFSKYQRVGNKSGYLHAKAIVVDQQRAWIGSVNGSYTSLNLNREFGVFVDQPNAVKGLAALMTADLNHASAQTWPDSMQCRRKIGWRSPLATTKDSDSYKTYKQNLQAIPAKVAN